MEVCRPGDLPKYCGAEKDKSFSGSMGRPVSPSPRVVEDGLDPEGTEREGRGDTKKKRRGESNPRGF